MTLIEKLEDAKVRTVLRHADKCFNKGVDKAISIVRTHEEWKPIEEAPRDGSSFLIDAPDLIDGVSIAFWDDDTLCSSFNGKSMGGWVTFPTVFLPLPQPPTKEPKP